MSDVRDQGMSLGDSQGWRQVYVSVWISCHFPRFLVSPFFQMRFEEGIDQ